MLAHPAYSGNVCFSPVSIAMCFALLTEGASGNTYQQLINTFHLPKDFLDRFDYMAQLLQNSKSTIKIANSAWINDRLELNPDYVTSIKMKISGAEFNSIRFGSTAANQINQWVREKTDGYIEGIIDSLDSSTLLVLLNAVYFNGSWLQQFDSHLTSERPFYLLDNAGQRTFPMMHNPDDDFEFTNQPTFSAVALPYKGYDTSMIILLPKLNTRQELDRLCTSQFLNAFFASRKTIMQRANVDLKLPKFTFETTFDLIPLLASLGLTNVFDSNHADLSRLLPRNSGAHVSTALHKTFIECDETGTRAAAVTALCLDESCMVRCNVQPFHADHPFVFVIYNQTADQILFIGRVLN
jgi:serpin B